MQAEPEVEILIQFFATKIYIILNYANLCIHIKIVQQNIIAARLLTNTSKFCKITKGVA